MGVHRYTTGLKEAIKEILSDPYDNLAGLGTFQKFMERPKASIFNMGIAVSDKGISISNGVDWDDKDNKLGLENLTYPSKTIINTTNPFVTKNSLSHSHMIRASGVI